MTAVRTTDGFSILGLQFRDPRYYVQIGFIVPERCADQIRDLSDWPPADSGCRGAIATAGTVVGEGHAATGDLIVAIEIETSAECLSSVRPGMIWQIGESLCHGSL